MVGAGESNLDYLVAVGPAQLQLQCHPRITFENTSRRRNFRRESLDRDDVGYPS